MFCTTCGNECKEGSKFCNKCGAKLTVMPQDHNDGSGYDGSTGNGGGAGRTEDNTSKRRGIFSAKTQVCRRCGRTFGARMTKNFCPECDEIMKQKYENISGYVDYFEEMKAEDHKGDERFYDEVAAHRDMILEKRRPVNGFSDIGDLAGTIGDYRTLGLEEAKDILTRVVYGTARHFGGDIINSNFFLPGCYPGTVVDFDDVFAIGYTSMKLDAKNLSEGLMLLFFTNDPYMPVIKSYGMFKTGMISFKSKAGRMVIEDLYGRLCPNLQYLIQDLKMLGKQIKQDAFIKGNMDRTYVLDQIERARNKVFMGEIEAPQGNWELVKNYGWLCADDVRAIMRSKKKEAKFWDDVLNNA